MVGGIRSSALRCEVSAPASYLPSMLSASRPKCVAAAAKDQSILQPGSDGLAIAAPFEVRPSVRVKRKVGDRAMRLDIE